MKKLGLIALFLMISMPFFAQTRLKLGVNVCHIDGQISLESVDVFTASNNIVKKFEEVLAYVPFPQHYVLWKTKNAGVKMLAAIDEANDEERVIVYDETYLATMIAKQDEKWTVIFTIAHEIGHHCGGHTLKNAHFKQEELDADYFAGYILGKMGATKDAVLRSIEGLTPHPNDEIHPAKKDRIDAILDGWGKAKGMKENTPHSVDCPNPNIGDLLIKNNINSPISLMSMKYEGSGINKMLAGGWDSIGVVANGTATLAKQPIGTHILTYRSNKGTQTITVTVNACADNRINIDN